MGRRLMRMGVPGGNGWQPVSIPAGYTYIPPFTIQRKGDQFRAFDTVTHAVFDVATLRPTGKAYYVATDGNDSNDGLSAAAPLRKFATARAKADVVEIRMAAGAYGFTNGWTNAAVSKDLSIIAEGGRVIMGNFAEGLTWTKQADPNEHVYRASRTSVGDVADATQTDANGYMRFLTTKASIAEVEAAAGSWYTDATYVYVRTADDRAPDANIRCFFSNVEFAGNFYGAKTLYCEGIDFQSAPSQTDGAFKINTSAGPLVPTGYFKNCTFMYGGANGLTTQGAITICQSCTAAKNIDDGFNYHAGDGGLPYAVEINCVGKDNGAAGDIDNGSSIHDGGSMVRLNGEYARNVGPNVQDISTGTESWNLGCYAHDSASGVNDENWKIGGLSQAAKMWLDTCRADGSATDLYADTGATIYARHTTGVSGGTGTISAY